MLTRTSSQPHISWLWRSPKGQFDQIDHFYGIDLLRGFSAIAVLIYHYQHFYQIKPFTASPPIDLSVQPLYHFLFPLYNSGFWAVQLFWIISGFVFAHVYAGKKSSASDFAVARFARLYPLHCITLVTVALLQIISQIFTGQHQIVSLNDPYDFLLNVLFLSGWGFQNGLAFNFPIWSVSIEIAIYALFFVLSRRIFSFGLLVPILVIAVSWSLIQGRIQLFAMCAYFFFIGTAVYFLLLRFRHRPIVIFFGCLLSFIVFVVLAWTGAASAKQYYNPQTFLFPAMVAAVGWLELSSRFRRSIRPVKWIGDATYSMYLWHFPVQVAVMTAFAVFGLSHSVFDHAATLVVWIVGMMLLAHLSFVTIERPLGAAVKTMLNSRATKKPYGRGI